MSKNAERTYIMVKVSDQRTYPPRRRSNYADRLVFTSLARRCPEGTRWQHHRPFRGPWLQARRLEACSRHPRTPWEAYAFFSRPSPSVI